MVFAAGALTEGRPGVFFSRPRQSQGLPNVSQSHTHEQGPMATAYVME